MDKHGLMLVNQNDLGLVCRDVYYLDRGGLVCNGNREGVVDEDTDDYAILEADEEGLLFGRA